ncbi:MAG: MASE4 domain-containing protein, partial [Alphaproteobacteria bacterium]|nr:MASE4 domain-containing protein [Alphaproteobacteria bacterium]
GQTTAWCYMFWHGGFPLFVLGYAYHAGRDIDAAGSRGALPWLVMLGTVAAAAGLTILAAAHEALLPTLLVKNSGAPGFSYSSTYMAVVVGAWLLNLAAMAAIWLRRRHTVLDLWLMVVLCAFGFDIALAAVFNSERFDLGFYAGRGYGLLAASFVLGVLLVETGGLHSRLAAAKRLVDDHARRLEERVRERTAELEAETAERQRTEAELHQAQKMEALGQLTGGLAHDFNNHLGIIVGNLDLLRDGGSLGAEQQELVDDALSAAFNGAELTRRLLAFARRQPLRPARIEVNRLVEQITKLLRRTLGEKIEIRLALDPAVSPVVADPAQLETAIANLANNARDAMPGAGRLTIATASRHLDEDYAAEHLDVRPGPYVLIEVSDTGTGMAPETAARVFEPFFTTKEPGKGTGLGLSMVFGFIKQSGGHINVYSESGHGTTFRLYLPPGETVAEPAAPAPEVEFPRGSGERVLVVEDNCSLRAVVVRQLVELGYAATEADDAAAALALLDAGESYDVLLSDVVMPGPIDGFALAEQFTDRRPGVKVLLTSGFPDGRLAEIGDLDSGLRLLSKPYRKRDLARVLREVLAETVPVC